LNAMQSALAPAADQAQAIDGIWRLMLWICVPMYALVLIGVAVVIWRMRRVAPEFTPSTPSDAQISRALVAWVVVIVAGLIVLTLGSFFVDRQLIPGQGADVNIRITGMQWWWQIEYVSDDASQRFMTANELHLPVGKTVHIDLMSGDVIHSFWVPNLSGKRDLIPGRTNTIELTPRQVGTFRGQCAEFCGLQHAKMAMLVFVDSENDFKAWWQRQVQARNELPSDVAKQGEQLFVSSACAMCHTVRGTIAGSQAGPDLTHLASRHTLAAGALPFNAGSLAAWLADPQTQKPGTNMPTVDLEPDQLNALVAYLMSLQ
jgi:cytochrome c oxidase subunit II